MAGKSTPCVMCGLVPTRTVEIRWNLGMLFARKVTKLEKKRRPWSEGRLTLPGLRLELRDSPLHITLKVTDSGNGQGETVETNNFKVSTTTTSLQSPDLTFNSPQAV